MEAASHRLDVVRLHGFWCVTRLNETREREAVHVKATSHVLKGYQDVWEHGPISSNQILESRKLVDELGKWLPGIGMSPL